MLISFASHFPSTPYNLTHNTHPSLPMFRHRRLLHFRQIKHNLYLRRLGLRAAALQSIRSQQQDFLSLQDLSAMTAEQRQELRARNPEFPPTMFMTQQEKTQFFIEKGDQFMYELESSAQRHCKSKKIVKFVGKVEHFYDPNSQILDGIDWS